MAGCRPCAAASVTRLIASCLTSPAVSRLATSTLPHPACPGGTNTNAGWTVGGGVEFALPGNWSAKAEYLHVDLGGFNCGANCGGAPNQNVSMRDNVFRAGVNYHFGWGK